MGQVPSDKNGGRKTDVTAPFLLKENRCYCPIRQLRDPDTGKILVREDQRR